MTTIMTVKRIKNELLWYVDSALEAQGRRISIAHLMTKKQNSVFVRIAKEIRADMENGYFSDHWSMDYYGQLSQLEQMFTLEDELKFIAENEM